MTHFFAGLWLAFVGTFVVGWVLNVIALINMIDAGVTGMLIARAIGVLAATLGAVLGLFF